MCVHSSALFSDGTFSTVDPSDVIKILMGYSDRNPCCKIRWSSLGPVMDRSIRSVGFGFDASLRPFGLPLASFYAGYSGVIKIPVVGYNNR